MVDTALGAIPGGTGAKTVAKESAKLGAEITAKRVAKEASEKATKEAAEKIIKPSGAWKKVNESMSDASRAYQKQITGRSGEAYVQNGVKFDGVIGDKLVDAKCHYSQFVDKDTGKFAKWFTGQKALVDEANRQIKAANGVSIQWYFAEKEAMEAVKKLFDDCTVKGIEFIFKAAK